MAILSRVIEPADECLTPDAARTLLSMRFPKADERRMNQLAAKARKGTLSERDRDEAEQYNLVGHMLALLQAKARRGLKQVRHRSRRRMKAILKRQVWQRAGGRCEYCRMPSPSTASRSRSIRSSPSSAAVPQRSRTWPWPATAATATRGGNLLRIWWGKGAKDGSFFPMLVWKDSNDKYVEKAHRRGKVGWMVGRRIEVLAALPATAPDVSMDGGGESGAEDCAEAGDNRASQQG